MKRINFITRTSISSYYYVVKYAIAWLDPSKYYTMISNRYVAGALNIFVEDMWYAFNTSPVAEVYWLDTALYYADIVDKVRLQRRMRKNVEVWVTSEYNAIQCRKYFPDCRVVGRLVSPILFAYRPLPYSEKIYDLAFFGKASDPRKNYSMFTRICRELNLKCWSTTNYNTLSLYELIDRIRKTKYLLWITLSEGFGMPLMESQALGVPAICSDAHANKEYCYTGIIDNNMFVDVKEVKPVKYLWYRTLAHIPDYEDLKRAVKYALSMGEEEYNKLSQIVREKARQYNIETTNRLTSLLDNL